ncbi:hypothetical protein Tco_1208327, partial [Tanacetum coccineum]
LMVEEQDEQQQQNMLDVELDPINNQVNIGISNFRIAFEKTQPDVVYKVCLEILNQFSVYKPSLQLLMLQKSICSTSGIQLHMI